MYFVRLIIIIQSLMYLGKHPYKKEIIGFYALCGTLAYTQLTL